MADLNGGTASKPSQTHLPSPNTSQSNAQTPPPTNSNNTTSPDQPQTSQSQSQSQSQPQANSQPTNTTSAAAADSQDSSRNGAVPNVPTSNPPTSLADPGTSTRPRDARTIHMVLAALGVTAYQERVPLQLLDFAYRYTASVLADAQHLAAEGYASGTGSSSRKGGAAGADDGISLAAVRLATSSRVGHQFGGTALPKETLLELAAERNRVKLPQVDKETSFGVRLPHERFVMTGTGWDLAQEWDSEDELAAAKEADASKMAEAVNGGDSTAPAAAEDETAQDEGDQDAEMVGEDAEMAEEPLPEQEESVMQEPEDEAKAEEGGES